jgi:hypothetical protein
MLIKEFEEYKEFEEFKDAAWRGAALEPGPTISRHLSQRAARRKAWQQAAPGNVSTRGTVCSMDDLTRRRITNTTLGRSREPPVAQLF